MISHARYLLWRPTRKELIDHTAALADLGRRRSHHHPDPSRHLGTIERNERPRGPVDRRRPSRHRSHSVVLVGLEADRRFLDLTTGEIVCCQFTVANPLLTVDREP